MYIKKKKIIENISNSENISQETLKNFIKIFEKYIKSEINKYEDLSGLEDFKLNLHDYIILHELYFSTKSSPYKIQILLLFMYSYYKLDGICFNRNNFPFKLFFDFLFENKNIHYNIIKLIKQLNY